jgi:hypothetical protein
MRSHFLPSGERVIDPHVVVDDEDDDERDGLVPYAPDFTPATLGKRIGPDEVLEWLLTRARSGPKQALSAAIATECLGHIVNPNDRRDMASHVIQGLQNYLLVNVDDQDQVMLTQAGSAILATPRTKRDEEFARHILTMCNGYRLIEAIHRFDLRGEKATLEALTEELDRSATAKNISTMKAWLERARVMDAKRGYTVNDARVDELLGRGTMQLFGLDDRQVEFILAARILTAQQQSPVLEAVDVKLLAETRRPDVRLPSKALGSFVRTLVEAGLLSEHQKARAKGGSRVTVKLTAKGVDLTDDQVRELVKQAGAGIPLDKLLPLAVALEDLVQGTAESRGRFGEMLAVHASLMLGVRVVGWRTRAPVEIDLTAERTCALTYQRWHVQVKNTEGDVDADRVDREIGAAAGTGATHLLFVVPRAGLTTPARAEIDAKNKLTHLHIFVLTKPAFGAPVKVAALLRELRGQEARVARIKRLEAERRERT